jgi:hypothetical protein
MTNEEEEEEEFQSLYDVSLHNNEIEVDIDELYFRGSSTPKVNHSLPWSPNVPSKTFLQSNNDCFSFFRPFIRERSIEGCSERGGERGSSGGEIGKQLMTVFVEILSEWTSTRDLVTHTKSPPPSPPTTYP